MLCAEIDISGYVIEDVASTAPDCAQLMLITPAEYDSMTYWAELAIALEPGEPAFNALVTAMITAYGIVAAYKMWKRAVRIESEKAG